jgi:hypothetical protein
MALDILLRALALAILIAGKRVAAVYTDGELTGHEDIKKGFLRSSGGGGVSRSLIVSNAAFVLPLFSLEAYTFYLNSALLILLTFLLLSYFLNK